MEIPATGPREQADPTEPGRARMAEIVERHLAGADEKATAIPGLTIHGRTIPSEPASYLYEPSFAFIVRGSKRVILGDETLVYDESHFLLTAIGLPTVVQVIGASEDAPYVSLKWDIDLAMARDLITDVDRHMPASRQAAPGMSVGPVTNAIAGAASRLVDLLDAPEDIPILAGAVQRDILYRVLTGPVGGRLRQAVQIGSQTNRVATAIRYIRENFTRPLRVKDIARVAAMGESTLHHHFRSLTAMTPLQYQKNLRLHEARRLMINDGVRAGSAAHRVGYESATQFNREYSRLFGAPPGQDVRSILSAGATAALADGAPRWT